MATGLEPTAGINRYVTGNLGMAFLQEASPLSFRAESQGFIVQDFSNGKCIMHFGYIYIFG